MVPVEVTGMRFALMVVMVMLLVGCQKQPASGTTSTIAAAASQPSTSAMLRPTTGPAVSTSPRATKLAAPNPFAWPQSVKTRKELLATGHFPKKWTELTHNGMKIAVAIEELPTDSESYIDVYGYVYNLHFTEWRQFFAVKIRGAGDILLRHDKAAGLLSVRGAANNDLNGKPLFTFDLSAVYDDRSYVR